jgi:hypothetical protein
MGLSSAFFSSVFVGFVTAYNINQDKYNEWNINVVKKIHNLNKVNQDEFYYTEYAFIYFWGYKELAHRYGQEFFE